jgi:pSer/pThr/pTyr-binding forkhead associated (FHA) protein
VTNRGGTFELFEYQRPKTPYIFLEQLGLYRNKKGNQKVDILISVMHLLKIDRNSIKIGRGRHADYFLSDISISRVHCFIVKGANHSFYLVDNNSKFGTQYCLL